MGEVAHCHFTVEGQVSCQDKGFLLEKAGCCPWHKHKPLRTHEIQLYHLRVLCQQQYIFLNQKNLKHIYDLGMFNVFSVHLPSVDCVLQKPDLCVNAQRGMYGVVI